MAGFIRKIFCKSPVAKPNAAAAERDAFLQKLGEQDIFIIAEMQSDGIDPDAMTKEQLLAEVERAAKDLNDRKHFGAFVYSRDGKLRLPFFTSLEYAKIFIGEYSKECNRVYPFELLGIKGSLLAKVLLGCDVLAMNDRSADEVLLTDDDVAAIQRMWG